MESISNVYLNDSQAQSRLLGQCLPHFAARFGRHIERGLERASLLRIQYGSRSLWSTSAVHLRREHVFGKVVVNKVYLFLVIMANKYI